MQAIYRKQKTGKFTRCAFFFSFFQSSERGAVSPGRQLPHWNPWNGVRELCGLVEVKVEKLVTLCPYGFIVGKGRVGPFEISPPPFLITTSR